MKGLEAILRCSLACALATGLVALEAAADQGHQGVVATDRSRAKRAEAWLKALARGDKRSLLAHSIAPFHIIVHYSTFERRSWYVSAPICKSRQLAEQILEIYGQLGLDVGFDAEDVSSGAVVGSHGVEFELKGASNGGPQRLNAEVHLCNHSVCDVVFRVWEEYDDD